jgi:hypothetical protein
MAIDPIYYALHPHRPQVRPSSSSVMLMLMLILIYERAPPLHIPSSPDDLATLPLFSPSRFSLFSRPASLLSRRIGPQRQTTLIAVEHVVRLVMSRVHLIFDRVLETQLARLDLLPRRAEFRLGKTHGFEEGDGCKESSVRRGTDRLPYLRCCSRSDGRGTIAGGGDLHSFHSESLRLLSHFNTTAMI